MSTHGSTRVLVALHALLALYSLSSICGKLAAGFDFLSLGFILCYGGMIAVLGIYAIGWQQIIKRVPLTFAYANRAVTVVWGIIWGALFFHEGISPLKLLGAAIVLAGVVLYASTEYDDETSDSTSAQHEGGEA